MLDFGHVKDTSSIKEKSLGTRVHTIQNTVVIKIGSCCEVRFD